MLTSPDTSRGLLLIAHGTRDPAGQEESRAVVCSLAAALPDVAVELCFLELAEPTISTGMARLVERGVRQLTVQPLLLFAADHAKRDIPAELEKAASQFPDVAIRQVPVLGCHKRLLELSELRFREAIAGTQERPDSDTLLLMVGRGSRDADANSEMSRFSRLRWEQRRFGWVENCYLAMTWPSLSEGLAMAARLEFPRVVVQPHLLFHGELVARVERETTAIAARHSDKEWLVASHLGPHPLLIEALMETPAPS